MARRPTIRPTARPLPRATHEPTAEEVLATRMIANDADAGTIRDYLRELVRAVWEEGESFSGKRPFGNSGWESGLEYSLFMAGLIDGHADEDTGNIDWVDSAAAIHLVNRAIGAL